MRTSDLTHSFGDVLLPSGDVAVADEKRNFNSSDWKSKTKDWPKDYIGKDI